MVGPIRFDGPLSGIDFTSIIEASLRFQQLPIRRFENDIAQASLEKAAFLELNVFLLGLKSPADTLAGARIYASTDVSSSNESALTVSGSTASALGAFTFTPHRLAQSHQMISNGFADADTTPVTTSAATISIDLGNGSLRRSTSLDSLNDRAGVDRGSIKIVDSSGQGALVDLSAALDVQDVLDAINGNTSVSVQASVSGNRLVLKDQAGGAGTLSVQDAGLDTTATDLGIAKSSTTVGSDQFVFGSDINYITGSTPLSVLNDGLGVRRNADGIADFSLRGQSGPFFDVDIQSTDLTIDDVLARINAAAPGGFTAYLSPEGNSIVLEDLSGGNNSLDVTAAADSFAAVDLGLGVISGGTFVQRMSEREDSGREDQNDRNRLVGNSLISGLNSIQRTLLNGGQTNLDPGDVKGVSDGTITITDRDGHSVTFDATQQFFTQVDGNVSAGSNSIVVDDVSGFAVGNRIRFQNDGAPDDQIQFRTVTAIDVSQREIFFDEPLAADVDNNDGIRSMNESVQDLINLINFQAEFGGAQRVDVRAELNPETNGLRIVDFSGGSSSNLIVSGAPADDLGISGSVAGSTISGGDLNPQYIGEGTRLSSLNSGDGVAAGKIRVVDTNGTSFTVDLSQDDDDSIGEVINEINALASVFGSGVVARVNDTGDGIVLTDTTPGGGTLQVQEVDNGTTARDLGLLGVAPSASPDTLDGSFDISIDIEANATLEDIVEAINAQGLGVAASVLNDGSSQSPFRLSLTRTKSGAEGRFTVSTDISGLSFSTSSQGQDAVVLYGGGGSGAEATVITSSTNSITGVVAGLTLDLKSPTAAPVTVSVNRNTQAVADEIQRFVTQYNSVVQKIQEFTAFDVDTFNRGILFGDPSVFRIQRTLSRGVVPPVAEIPQADLNHLREVGIRVQSNGTLSLDSSLLQSKLSTDFEQVRSLFNYQRRLEFDTPVSDINGGLGLTDVAGDDFTITPGDGASFGVNVAGVSTVGALLSRINNDPGNSGRVTAQLSSDGFSIELIDRSGASTVAFEVANQGGGKAASELRIAKTLAIGKTTLTGDPIGLQGDPGVATRMSESLDFLVRFGDGVISRKTAALDDEIQDLEDSIDDQEELIARLERDLVLQFSRLEVAIAESNIAGQSLSFLLSGLSAGGGSQGTL